MILFALYRLCGGSDTHHKIINYIFSKIKIAKHFCSATFIFTYRLAWLAESELLNKMLDVSAVASHVKRQHD